MYGATEFSRNESSRHNSSRKICGLTYKIRRLRNRGGFLTLFWSSIGFLLLFYCVQIASFDMKIAFAVSLVFYPLAGFLADVYYGRHKVIRFSLWLVFAAVLAYNCILAAQNVAWSRDKAHKKNESNFFHFSGVVLGGIGLVGLSGFQANILQFGIDQFIDASSVEISAYISWYVWIIYLSRCVIIFSQVQDCSEVLKKQYNSLLFIFIPVVTAIAAASDYFLSRWLIIEPVVHNPIKLIYEVIRYALNNKYPRLRSAFTYWDDKPFSRMDLGKAKFGGPFTTEQVEDVKTFFRVLLLILVAGLLMGICFILQIAFTSLINHYRDGVWQNGSSIEECYMRKAVTSLADVLILGFIPVLEFVLYPLFRRCTACAKLSIMYRFLLGIFILSLYELCLMSTEAVSIQTTANSTCFMFEKDSPVPVVTDYRWLVLSKIFSTGSMYLLITSSIEFIYAQAPYSMKGLFAGIVYCWCGLVAAGAIFAIRQIHKGLISPPRISFASHTCGVWFYGSAFVFTLFLLCLGFGFLKWYTLRRRDENVHNEQIFAVDYFDRYHASPGT